MQKRSEQARSLAKAVSADTDRAFEFRRVVRSIVGKMHSLEVTPHSFVRIELRRIRRKELQVEARSEWSRNPSDLGGFVNIQVVPQENNGPAKVAPQMAQEELDAFPSDRAAAQPEVELALESHAGDGRQLGPVGAVPQDRRVAFGRPGAHARRNQRKARFIGKDERGLQASNFFLIRGHSWSIHRRIFRSLRSSALRTGFWGVHPHCRSSLGMW